jgi:hypothetical protein
MLEAGPGDLLQHGPRSYKLQLWVGGTIHLMCGWHGRQRARLWPVEHAVYDEIERGGGLSADNFQVTVTVVEGGRAPPRRRLQRLAVFKASGIETNLLGNQHRLWRLHPIQNGVALNQIEHRPPRVVNLMRFLKSVWLKKVKGAVTLYKPDCGHIHKHSNMHTFQKRRTAGPRSLLLVALDLKTCYLTRKGVNLRLPYRVESRWCH